jgi:hypothetical protein
VVAPSSGAEDDSGRGPTVPGAVPGIFQPPSDTTTEDVSLPSGTVAIDVRNADDKVVPGASLVVFVLRSSATRGQSMENLDMSSDTSGHAQLDHLQVGSEVSYSVAHRAGPAIFSSAPFRLTAGPGMRVVLHVYSVTRDLAAASIVNQGALYLEVKDDHIVAEEAITIFNFGKTAWFPDDVVLQLPRGFTSVISQPLMNDRGVDAVELQGVRLRGTFSPGRHDVEFRWQLPYHDARELTLDVGLPPRVAVMRVLAATGRDGTLEVSGFPEPDRRTDRQGQRLLVTEKQLRPDDPLSSVHVILGGLVAPGLARLVVTSTASLTVFLGLVLAARRSARRTTGPAALRAILLAEIADLESAHVRGEVGPRTYERARRELVDALARTLEPTT